MRELNIELFVSVAVITPVGHVVGNVLFPTTARCANLRKANEMHNVSYLELVLGLSEICGRG